MRLYIIRHADPDYANDTITELGRRQAEVLGERLERIQLDHLYSSPMGRARATAAATEKRKGMAATVLSWTRECHMVYENPPGSGKKGQIWDLDGHRIRGFNPLPTDQTWNSLPPMDNPEYGRILEEIGQHSDQFLAGHGYVREGGVYRVERSHTEAMAVFCHGGFGLNWLSHLLAIAPPIMWAGFFLHPTSITTILFDERGDGMATPRCMGLGDVAHLEFAEMSAERVPVGIKANYH